MVDYYQKKIKGRGLMTILGLRMCWLCIAVIVSGLALAMFQVELLGAERNAWKDYVNPCLSVCTRSACECIKLCKAAAGQEDNTACSIAAPALHKNYTICGGTMAC